MFFFCAVFVLKRVGRLCSFGMKSGMVFEGTTGVYERICRLNRKKERHMKSFHMSLNPFQRVFGNHDIFSADARSENGSVETEAFFGLK